MFSRNYCFVQFKRPENELCPIVGQEVYIAVSVLTLCVLTI